MRLTILPVLALVLAATTADAQTLFPGAVARPNVRGDQVIMYYDVRDGFTTFLNLRNEAASELRVDILFYSGDFTTPFAHTVTVPFAAGTAGAPGTGGSVVIDAGGLRAAGLPAAAGIAIATTVDATGQPVATRGLSGNFTVANSATGSAWGSPGAARSAIHPPASDATCLDTQPAVTLGTAINGTDPVLTPIQPGNADLAVYYNPDTLAPAAIGGNQLIFVSFVDVPGTTYGAATGATRWTAAAVRNTGEPLPSATVDVSGVLVTDLASVLGPTVGGSGGSITFTATASSAPLTRMIFFTESLGTFSTGYLLPRR